MSAAKNRSKPFGGPRGGSDTNVGDGFGEAAPVGVVVGGLLIGAAVLGDAAAGVASELVALEASFASDGCCCGGFWGGAGGGVCEDEQNLCDVEMLELCESD
jgi:hypothetical protein